MSLPYESLGDETEEIIDLEPTGAWSAQPSLAAADPEESAHVALMAGSMPSITTEATDLLRERLNSAALFLGVVYCLLALWNLLIRDGGLWIIPATQFTRCVLSLSVILLLNSGLPLTLRQLRLVEYAYFGLLTLLLILSQYMGNLEFLRRGQIVYLVAFEKNGLMQLFGMMMIYGVLIPNDPKTTAKVVLSMALGPLLVLSILLERHIADSRLVDDFSSEMLAGSNALYVTISAALAIYTAHVLNRLRNQLREARRFGHYKLGERLGSGGMGDVYMAEHELLKRPCALKLIKADVDQNPVALARFEREVQAAARLSHPNVIEIFDYGHTDDGTFYYVMEYLPGLSLNDLILQFGAIPPGRAIHLMRQVCGALAEAHGLGLVHRDLKPANVFVAIRGGEYDVAKVLDFGLVKLTAEPQATQLTMDKTVSGTPTYMSPEQATGAADIDPRADLYALGAILYFALTGRPPFAEGTAMEIMIAHARDPVVAPSTLNPDIPPDLEAVILRCLGKKPGDRYATARELGRALGACGAAADWDAEKAESWWVAQAEDAAAGTFPPTDAVPVAGNA